MGFRVWDLGMTIRGNGGRERFRQGGKNCASHSLTLSLNRTCVALSELECDLLVQDTRRVFDQTAADACRYDGDEEVEDISTGSDKAPSGAATKAVTSIHGVDESDEESVDDDGGERKHRPEEEKQIKEGEEESDPAWIVDLSAL